MDKRINDLKINFNTVINLKNENIGIFDVLKNRIIKLKTIYSDIIKNNNEKLFIFGLDSFYFQSKIIDIENDDMHRLYNAITNRIYCEYFKLYKILIEYIIESIDDKKILASIKSKSDYPIYKDLEPFKQYDFEIILDIHDTIIGLLLDINNYITNKECELKLYQDKNTIGLNIDNFVNTYTFNNMVIREKLLLFITYIEFFHKLHIKYFTRFTTKMQLFISQINHDIKFDDSIPLNEEKKQFILNNIEDDGIDGILLNILKQNTIYDTSPSTTFDEYDLNNNDIQLNIIEKINQSDHADNTDNISCLSSGSFNPTYTNTPINVKKRGRPKKSK